MCQLRNAKSQLQNDLYRDYLADSPTCSTCNSGVPETVQHYTFDCAKYEVERLKLISSLLKYTIIYESLNELNARNLITGIPELLCEDNEKLFDIFIELIQRTGRFNF